MKKNNILMLFIALFVFAATSTGVFADTAVKNQKSTDSKGDKTQSRTYSFTQLYDNQLNTISNFEFYNSNYGIFGQDIQNNSGGGY
jgi:hypothetical protein